MTSNGTTKHSIRVADPLWDRYLQICRAEGTNCAADIREHIQRRVDEHDQQEPSQG